MSGLSVEDEITFELEKSMPKSIIRFRKDYLVEVKRCIS